MTRKTIFLISTSGTIEKNYCEQTGAVSNFELKIESYIDKIWLPHRIENFSPRSSLVVRSVARSSLPTERTTLLKPLTASKQSPRPIRFDYPRRCDVQARLREFRQHTESRGEYFCRQDPAAGVHPVMHGEVFDTPRAREDPKVQTLSSGILRKHRRIYGE
jgi:hypothetical protein